MIDRVWPRGKPRAAFVLGRLGRLRPATSNLVYSPNLSACESIARVVFGFSRKIGAWLPASAGSSMLAALFRLKAEATIWWKPPIAAEITREQF
jgi:hypothetical protein